MNRSWQLGNAFGIGLYVHWSFLLVPAFVLFSTLNAGMTAAVAGVVLVLALFGCVLLHELGHALMARSYGIGTRDITLYPIGGVARLERMPDQPMAEILIAIAGPLVNVVIAGGLWIGFQLSGRPLSLDVLSHNFLIQLLLANVGLVVFNMIPAFPMDGGRVFRAFLALFMNRVRATEIAVSVSRVLAVGFILVALTPRDSAWATPISGSPMLAVIAAFLFLAGAQELKMVRWQAGQRFDRHPGMPRPAEQFVTVDTPVAANWSGFTWDPRAGLWIQWHNGQPISASSVGGFAPPR